MNSDPNAIPPDPNHTDAPLTAPSATVKVDPKYPPEVIREKVEGHVILYAVLRKDGIIDPATVRIIQKLDPRLDVSARDALIGWKFKPSLKSGQPVEIQAEITIPFISVTTGSSISNGWSCFSSACNRGGDTDRGCWGS